MSTSILTPPLSLKGHSYSQFFSIFQHSHAAPHHRAQQQHHPAMAAPIPLKGEVLSRLNASSYQQRAHYAATLGRDHQQSPKLQELINDLRKVQSILSGVSCNISDLQCSTHPQPYLNMKQMRDSQKCSLNNRPMWPSTTTRTTSPSRVLQHPITCKC